MNHPLSKSKAATRPAMLFDTSKPYRLEFGRGSGWEGLDTIALNESGHVVEHRHKRKHKGNSPIYWEKRSYSISPEAMKEIATLIRDLRIVEMERAYHADVHDGTQWVFWLVQGGQEKSVYFNNHFPKAILEFAVALDDKLRSAEIDKSAWKRVPDNESRSHEKAIWNSIRDKPHKTD